MYALLLAVLLVENCLGSPPSLAFAISRDVHAPGSRVDHVRNERERELNFALEDQLGFLFGKETRLRPHLADISRSEHVSDRCKNDSEFYMQKLSLQETWAMSMLDASSKIPSGIMSGNFIWFGNFEQCLQIQVTRRPSTTESFRGQYCLASFRPNSTINNVFKTVYNRFEDQLLLYPITTGICLPSSCTAKDLEAYLQYLIDTDSLNVTAHVDPTFCQVQKEEHFDGSATAVTVLLILFASLVVVATVTEYVTERMKVRNARRAQQSLYAEPTPSTSLNPRRFFDSQCAPDSLMYETVVSFSLVSNGKGLLNTSQPKGSIGCLHGMRVFSMLWIILLHCYSNSLPYMWRNFKEVHNIKRDVAAEMILNGNVAVDTFFFLSGLLVCYVTIRKLQKTGKFGLLHFYVHRYFRITPVYAIAIAIAAGLFPYISSGPHWPEVIQQSDNCKVNWWTNLLYVSNIVNTPKMCQPHCWFLSADWQLYLLSPLIIYPLHRWPKIGVSIAMFFICVSIAIDSALTYTYHLPPTSIVLAAENLEPYYIYTILLYMMPYLRFGPYCVGVLLGYLLATNRMNFKMKWVVVVIGWSISLAVALAVVFGLYKHVAYDTNLTPAESVLYSSFSRPAWGVFLAWVVIACFSGYGGPINRFLSWDIFIPLGRLAYCAYIIHYNLVVLYYSSRGSSTDFDHWVAMYNFIGTAVFANALATVFHLVFEVPAVRVERAILSWQERRRRSNNEATESRPVNSVQSSQPQKSSL